MIFTGHLAVKGLMQIKQLTVPFDQYRTALERELPTAQRALAQAIEAHGADSPQAKQIQSQVATFTQALALTREQYDAERTAAAQFLNLVSAVPEFELGTTIKVAPSITAMQAFRGAGFEIGDRDGFRVTDPLTENNEFGVLVDLPRVTNKALWLFPTSYRPVPDHIANVSVQADPMTRAPVLKVSAYGTEHLTRLREVLDQLTVQLGARSTVTVVSEAAKHAEAPDYSGEGPD